MSLATVSGIVNRLLQWGNFNPSLEISWHAGEPLTVPLDFYRSAIDEFTPVSQVVHRISHSIQTNASLVTWEHCEFFLAESISIGVSIDGPKWLHDTHRQYRNGAGSFDQTFAGIQKLREASVPFYAIMVATNSTLGHAQEVYDFMKESGVTFLGINVDELEGSNTASTLSVDHESEFRDFLQEIFKLSLNDGTVVIRELYMTATYLKLSALPLRSVSAAPGEILCFDRLGNVSTFSPELVPLTEAAGTTSIEIADALRRDAWRILSDSVEAGVTECELSCNYFSVCGGGNPSNKIAENGSAATCETIACRYQIKIITEVVLDLFDDPHYAPKIEKLISNDSLMRL